MPCSLSTSFAGGYIGLPFPPQISSVLVAAEAISNLSAMSSFSTMSLRTNSEMGERQMLPWQMKSIFIIVLFLLVLPRNALFCKGFRRFVKCVILLASWQNRARWSKLLRAVSSKIGSKTR